MITVRKGMDQGVLAALVSSVNALRGTVAVANSKFHKDATPAGSTTGDFTSPTVTALVIGAAASTDTASGVTLANELQTKMLVHFADAVAHKVADTTNNTALSGTAVATDDPTQQTLASALKTALNAHNDSTTFHYTADTSDNATTITDAATARTALNDIKTKFNTHLASCPAGDHVNLVNP